MANNLTGLMCVVFACTLSACDGDDAAIVAGATAMPAARTLEDSKTARRDTTAPADVVEPRVQLAAVLAREISAAPEQSSKILRRHGLDRDKLDTIMFEIAGDPELTRAYLVARRSR
ncbi:MAG TPA: hypothetical protein VGB85_16335 [Nannocystis sp.]